MKHQNPRTKFQINSNGENSKFRTESFDSLRVGICSLFGVWDLGFGIWDAKQQSKVEIIPFSLMLLMILALQVVACAKKGPPVPWDLIVPMRIVDLQAIPRDGRLLLEWRTPKDNTDKTPLTDLVSFQILRSEGTLVGEECKGCGGKPKVVREMKLTKEDFIPGKRMTLFVEDQEPRKVYVYQVVSINRRGYPSSPSNPVTVYWDHPPARPTTVSVERGDKKVALSWEPVEGATGYDVYRRLEGEEEFPLNPLNKEPLMSAEYTDLSVQNDIKYIYSVRAVRRVVKTDVEGKGSPGIAVTPAKLTPPSAPVGLVAIPTKEGIELTWNRNREPDILGYNVYRRKTGEKEFQRLNESPLPKNTYLDTDVVLEQEYEYAVTAVDNSSRRNESARSEEVSVKYLY
jgi:fibronectin type 3 domain-containing protein